MPTSGWCDRKAGRDGGRRPFGVATDADGTVPIEFALVLPILLLLLAGMIEVGRAYYQAAAIGKGIRAGAFYAARSPLPLDAAAEDAVRNLVRTGTLDGTGPLLVSGWSAPSAQVTIDTSGSYTLDESVLPVIRIGAVVPFDPMLGPVTLGLGIRDFAIRLSHEQVHVGE